MRCGVLIWYVFNARFRSARPVEVILDQPNCYICCIVTSYGAFDVGKFGFGKLETGSLIALPLASIHPAYYNYYVVSF